MVKNKSEVKFKCVDGNIYQGRLLTMGKNTIEVENVIATIESNLIPIHDNFAKKPLAGPVLFERSNIIWFSEVE